MVDQVEGADAAALTQKVTKHFGASAASVTGPIAPLPNSRLASNGTASTSGTTNGVPSKQQKLHTRLDQLVHSSPVLLFMKGTPTEPRCGFSAKVVDALQQAGIKFKHFDILSDDAVRQGLKVINAHPLSNS